MEIWASDNKDYHLYLFLLAIVFRIALQKIPKLREYEHGVQVRINDDFFYRSILSCRLYDKGFRRPPPPPLLGDNGIATTQK
jgi:hypothetical protein